MGFIAKVVLAVIVAVLSGRSALACSCGLWHPQASLCRNGTYAALVKVRNVEYVYTTERPKHETSKWKSSAANKPFSNVRTQSLDEGSRMEMEQVEVVVKDLKQLSQEYFVASHIRYRVKVYQTYKGLKREEVEGKKVYIYTAPEDSLCGVTLEPKTTYLLIGSIYENRLRIDLCDPHVMWNSLDSKQRKAVRRNMREADSTCDSSCHIQFCYSDCPKLDKNSCSWTLDKMRTSMKLKINPANYVCTRENGKQDSRCVWNNPVKALKRGRRHTRHHA